MKLFDADIESEFFSGVRVRREIHFETGKFYPDAEKYASKISGTYILKTYVGDTKIEEKMFPSVYELDAELERSQKIWESVLGYCTEEPEKEKEEPEQDDQEIDASASQD